MKLLVDALSVTNLSGRHVFLGHMTRLVRWTRDSHEWVVLRHRGNRDLEDHFDAGVEWIECPPATEGWAGRALWERTRLPELVRGRGADGIVTFSGISLGPLDVPQMTFASNPWCLVPEVHRGAAQHIKAGLQRRAYADTVGVIDTIAFASAYLRRAYAENATVPLGRTEVVYPGIDDRTFEAAEATDEGPKRDARSILTVSAMAPHKNLESVVRALGVVRRRHGVPARLRLVGGWPDAGYRDLVEGVVRAEGLTDHVDVVGYVSDDELLEHYRSASVFCLMSRCESFGIPAVEAQAFGTPVVSSARCAVPEVCGDGGEYEDPDDVDAIAARLAALLDDPSHWRARSRAARANAERFRWDRCSRPLVELIDRTFGGNGHG